MVQFVRKWDGGQMVCYGSSRNSGGLLLSWTEKVNVYQIKSSNFSLEIEFETLETNGRMWAVFVYASNKEKFRTEQWEELWTKRGQWGTKWIL